MHTVIPHTHDTPAAAPVRSGAVAVVVGTGRSGTAAARLLHHLGASVRIVEKDESRVSAEFASLAARLGFDCRYGSHSAEQFAGADILVPSPGVPVASLLPYLDASRPPEIMAEIDLAARCVTSPVLAVTGTSGKTTTVSLCAAMLRAAGKRVFLGGNIGTPLSEYVLDVAAGEAPADVLVLEVSSFQLQTCTTLRPEVAVLINISANHLDYHADMQEYLDAKFRLFALQGPDDLAVLQSGMEELADRYALAARREFFDAVRRFPRTALLGSHNMANIEAAWLACRAFGVTQSQAAQAVEEFAPLEHRLEKVDEVAGVLFVNDSKSTTVDSMKAALESFDRPVLLLCGGKWKGGDLVSLIPVVRRHAKAVGLFGASREIFEHAWADVVPMSWDHDLQTAFRRMTAMAQPGDVVLMSPATSSYDLYSNYKERGGDFKRNVAAWKAERDD
ncbi:UDP-N-acetylmuramoylalanine/D-glutamate ligase [Oleidesulfovibrio alaskensis G20]|uniref:UDP-N-acetylmuramoylalanine--D-glutamate ligase n=1 Tax=Oleidesulfovibrio alaskensis (strain ATCC BAA-1058 / DSM 17464 / G20) TaxID=207559 RepID=MURD_OLEA2|nr:UDP-N-acetylmuramoyl-L-alanine--D-glutamate ligase [Oleidesulfovibrio alaskensis]Q313Q5.1 RecName: Full=UDP-N-acetylmuramoylalanine--D-glutamate ligase; AltName: Full=D-glutamic acid-adding enzyme; AltName: Full=UDP-N-acetylmuramoyl-L-alanyl-D-glutamate synthetase [Oleidesulfovibrio alaskensis G20]ABB37841.1 UDP-N-acetylmuramoylalanine/D-glutamate ligase [Oleidesulfovibrio alaskensis G20]MBG0773700.1 UDP-N-acetylmuramoyl-L-alanine--D-glutamate ligase [Oleidesulfovibrio alaskensis]